MKPIKVLHISNVDKETYYFNNLADFSDADTVRYSFVTFAGEDCDFVRDIRARGREVFALDTMSRSSYPRAYRELGKLLDKLKPDIVHTHLFDPSVVGLTVAKRKKLRTVLTRHHSDAIHEIRSSLKRRFYLGLENYVSRNADHIIAPSQKVRECLVEWEGVPGEKVSIIPYGQTSARFNAVTREAVKAKRIELGMDKQLSIVCVSRLYHRKGHKYLFEAVRDSIREGLNTRIYLVGEGEYRLHLERYAEELGLAGNVEFLGWRSDILEIIAGADVIAHPSLEDALSQSLIESLMLARPIVATDISGAGDTLANGRFGRLVPPADSDSFRVALEETIRDLDGALARARKGREYLLEYMDAKRVADEYASLYRSLAN